MTQVSDPQTSMPEVPTVNNGTPDPAIKMENFGVIISELTKLILELVNQSRNRNTYGSVDRNISCNMCGGEHYIRDCNVVNEYIAAGKCRQNIDGKVVLSTGAFIPCEIPGTLLAEHIDEWHRCFPGQLVTTNLIHTINKAKLYPLQSAYQLSSSNRIAHLKAELYALRSRKSSFVLIVCMQAQAARNANIESSDEEEEVLENVPKKVIPPKVVVAPPSKKIIEVSAMKTPQPPPITTSTIEEVPEPEHPF